MRAAADGKSLLLELFGRVIAEGDEGAALGHASDLSALAGVVLGLGTSAVRALVDQHDGRREIEDNQLFFYHGAGEALRGVGRSA